MAGVKRDVLARLKVDGQKWKQGLDKANNQLGKFGAGAKKTLGFIRNHWMAITAAVVATGVAMRAALRPAMEWEDAQIRMKVVAQGNVVTLEKMRGLIDSESGGMFSRADTAAALNYAKAVGFNIDQAGKLLPLLKDTAAVYGEDLKTAMMAVVRAALFGEAELAERIGLTLRENAILDVTMRLYGKRLSQLSKEEKIIAVVTAATEQLSRVKGGEAEAANTASGATKRLGTSTKELLTEAIIPITPALASMANHFGDIADNATEAGKAADEFGRKLASGELGDWWDLYKKQVGGTVKSGVFTPFTHSGAGYKMFASFMDERKKQEEDEERVRIASFGEGGIGPSGFGFGSSAGRAWEKHVFEKEDRYEAFLKKYFPADPLPGEFEEFVARRNREMSASLSVVGAVGGPPDPHRIAGIDPGALTNLSGAEAGSIKQAQNAAEIEQMIMDDRAAVWESYGSTVNNVIGGITDANEVMLTKALMGEVNTSKKKAAMWRWAGKSFAASMVRAIADVAKQRAVMAFADGLSARGWLLGPMGSGSHFAAAAKYGLLAGVAGGVAGAMEQGAANEMKAFGETGIYGESSSNRITGTTSGSRGGIAATIARSPEVVNYNTTIIFEGTVIGGPQELYTEYFKGALQSDLRSGEIALPGMAA